MKALTPYLNFDGDCRRAMTFYHRCFGGELSLTSFGDAHVGAAPEANDRIMHASLTTPHAVLMASDTPPDNEVKAGNTVWLCVGCESDAEVAQLYAALGEGGTAVMPPQDAFWGDRFAMLTDRFGINWMLDHARADR